jgi:hypothetical protein
MFVGLNPSTADATNDDPTVRRCINYAKDWGYAALCMTNIFAFRATDPRDMKAVSDPIGPENDAHLSRLASQAGIVVAAWGCHGIHRGRSSHVLKLMPLLHALHVTKDGDPGHPLYLRGNATPFPYWVAVD